METDIANLTDEDLREQLHSYGVNAGPVVSSTRLFYEKKLGQVITSGGNTPSQPDTEEEEEDEEEEEEDEEVQLNFTPYETRQHETRPHETNVIPTMKPQYTSTPVTQSQDYTPITQARVAEPTQATARRTAAGRADETVPAVSRHTERERESGGGISMWIKLLFIVIVAFLVYLVVINMNPSAENKIPLTFDEKQV